MAPPRFIEVQKGKISLAPVIIKQAFEPVKNKVSQTWIALYNINKCWLNIVLFQTDECLVCYKFIRSLWKHFMRTPYIPVNLSGVDVELETLNSNRKRQTDLSLLVIRPKTILCVWSDFMVWMNLCPLPSHRKS